ncbi:MAG: VC2046/SO_2500 family protein [Alteromonadaceae bacterium]
MFIESVDSQILVHELQLGEQLNESVHSARRADFSLLLAMLSDDVQSHSQFFLPKTVTNVKNTNDATLRKEFELPENAPLSLDENHTTSIFNQAELIQNNNLAELHLSNVLSPKPLAFRDDKKHITQKIISNTSLYCQKKFNQQKRNDDGDSDTSRLSFDAKGWLKAVHNTIVKAPLLDAIA